MKERMRIAAALLICLVTAVLLPNGAAAQGKLNWNLRINETPGPLRSADMSAPSGKAALSEILAGPTNGSDNGYLIYTRMPPGAHGPSLFTLPVEHVYVVLSGKMTIQIGTEKFVLGQYTGAVIPPNTPHGAWNAESEPETHFEVISSANPHKDLSRNLMSMLKPAQATKVENAAKFIREIKLIAQADLKPGLNNVTYGSLKLGSGFQTRLDSAGLGGGNNTPHIHIFEQVYFVVEGEMTVHYGLETLTAKKGDIVIIQPGALHDNAATTPLHRHLTFLLPEPPPGPEFDVEFERKVRK